jgi:hypothetical protein
MIERSRRHGHFDSRFSVGRAGAGRPTANTAKGADELPGGLDWVAFSASLFPGRRSHDFEVLKAYEAYKDSSHAPAEEPARDPDAGLVLVGAG